MKPFIHALFADFETDVIDVSNVGETLAYTWFGRPNYAYSGEAQKYWIGTTRDTVGGTTQHITEFNIQTRTYTTVQVGTVFQKDDHNQVQILIRNSDKRLIAFYVEHNGSAIRWKISINPLDGLSWGAEKAVNPVSLYSYISPYQTSDGKIFIFFRANSTPAVWYYMKSTDGGETFSGLQQIYNNGSTQAYLISTQDGDKIHFTASNGHPQHISEGLIHSYHFYFDMQTETTHKTDGATITMPLTPSALSVVHLVTGNDASWILDVAVKNGQPRIIFAFYTDGMSVNLIHKSLYYSEWNGTAWTTAIKISDTMEGYIETDGSIQEMGYTGASRFNTSNSDIIWMPKQVNGILEIHKVDMSTTPPSITQITFNSTVNNWRPISIPSPINNVLWLKNNYYNMYDNYSITLQTKTIQ